MTTSRDRHPSNRQPKTVEYIEAPATDAGTPPGPLDLGGPSVVTAAQAFQEQWDAIWPGVHRTPEELDRLRRALLAASTTPAQRDSRPLLDRAFPYGPHSTQETPADLQAPNPAPIPSRPARRRPQPPRRRLANTLVCILNRTRRNP